ncbi:GbsR/MarR family transcriptional regulator [Flavobacterium sp. RHBU_3]|uniref:GbsR/MarR family transcriptional regulator n=1 Tax=Flavobacterium sp. RHBU_3 TaxID=3391184 RepID=UPI003984F86D
MDGLKQQREELIELFGVHFENIGHLPPLGSRILATLILDSCSRQYTFEDLVEEMSASKSSISTNLNLLLKMGKITYYTLPCDRKKYYRPSEFSERFDNYLKMIAFEKGIMEKMLDYRSKTVSCQAEKFELEKSKAYKEHILEMEALLNKSIERFKEIEKGQK